jgi:hypothetical protein
LDLRVSLVPATATTIGVAMAGGGIRGFEVKVDGDIGRSCVA